MKSPKKGRPSLWVPLIDICALVGCGKEAIRRRRNAGLLVVGTHFLEIQTESSLWRRYHAERCVEVLTGLPPEEAKALIAEYRAAAKNIELEVAL